MAAKTPGDIKRGSGEKPGFDPLFGKLARFAVVDRKRGLPYTATLRAVPLKGGTLLPAVTPCSRLEPLVQT